VFPIVPFSPELLDSHCLIDARTPLEYAEDHLPGAVNVPLLTNEERVEIGALYKQTGPHAARIRGLELTTHRFPAMVAAAAAAAAGRPLLVYCWRGGLRSATLATMLDLTGYPVAQLKGGYKVFRQQVQEYFADFQPPAPLVVLHGMTGIGKTTFLGHLDPERYTIIDLEGLAQHRGSAFGQLGLTQDLSQRHFDTLLWDAFRRAPANRPIILEGESRRIGRINLPGTLYDVMRDGIKVWCTASMETRVARLIEEYGREEYRQGMGEALERIRKKLGGDCYTEISGYLEQWALHDFMRGLMEHYYDRLYYKVRDWQEAGTISLERYDQAAAELGQLLDQQATAVSAPHVLSQ
jgi:tRNA 2-selenouridine synthase